MAKRAATRDDVCGPLGTPGGVAPELNAVTDAQLVTPLRVAGLLVSIRRWRELASDAHAYLTAHILATTPGLGLDPGGGDLAEQAGPLTSEADGPSSRAFGQWSGDSLAANDALLSTTPYGRMFLQLRAAQRGFGAALTSGGVGSSWA